MKKTRRLGMGFVFSNPILKLFVQLTGIILCALVIYYVVYQTGGTKYGYLHLMYIPIIVAGILFGIKGGVCFGVLGGVLIGPLMPIDTVTNEQQLVYNWLFRMFIFILTGLIVGIYQNRIQRTSKEIVKLYTHHQETGLPNLNSLHRGLKFKQEINTIITILIKDFDSILHLVGRNSYYELFKETHHRLIKILPNTTEIIHADNNKLWVCLKEGHATNYIDAILETLDQTYYIDQIPLYVEFSLGINNLKQGKDILQHLKESDEAAYYAQQMNIEWATYTPKLFQHNRYRELLGMFHDALNNQELEIYYQPKVALNDQNKPIGLEALIRWKHPNQGFISPAHFIPVVEQTQLINPLTEFVLMNSLELSKKLKQEGIHLSISINISAKNFQYSQFIERVIQLIAPYDLHEGEMEFEITETTLMENPDSTYSKLQQLRKNHIQLSIDDFGTGYSSLSYLSTYPIQIVKLDQYFIQRMGEDHGTRTIVQATIDVIHELGMKVLAEGVETKEIENLLIKMKADYAQGFLYAKPMNQRDVINWYHNLII